MLLFLLSDHSGLSSMSLRYLGWIEMPHRIGSPISRLSAWICDSGGKLCLCIGKSLLFEYKFRGGWMTMGHQAIMWLGPIRRWILPVQLIQRIRWSKEQFLFFILSYHFYIYSHVYMFFGSPSFPLLPTSKEQFLCNKNMHQSCGTPEDTSKWHYWLARFLHSLSLLRKRKKNSNQVYFLNGNTQYL
jgi:hypothetical protein